MRNLLPGSKSHSPVEVKKKPQQLLGPPCPALPSTEVLVKIQRLEMDGIPSPPIYTYRGYIMSSDALPGLHVTAKENVDNWWAALIACVSTIPVVELGAQVPEAILRVWVNNARNRTPFPSAFLDDNQLEAEVAAQTAATVGELPNISRNTLTPPSRRRTPTSFTEMLDNEDPRF